ncbi:hypothetical protein AJ85_03790 [Alkalihalobacillus alcalophilus ATCC 27647 = CGMCC 1.3604]|uniref:Prepilin-type N-terminal cleavage/methylation domain-containing protein n=1 Tax=Alkalihalobacillus alcalophilus ATCC 27647 = CGMCC 1.3604 TaxID=1218173 RepID=A0A4S4K1Y8_ALKAL|nr:prepilin-type N-terminal cleavage/methylation domain-containing protein [Alkalihalobacillus alcalophilus]MED1563380.1 prepilin-type N-terminal cleavage/methylation domain-containing protein [Alkalihalobacillus alcalophilus]THG91653.1 hypothetical protein AJ85_03790 [Alkalihalobacillus alcalophilus ATCC 27647 = CGMCC 1.3604]
MKKLNKLNKPLSFSNQKGIGDRGLTLIELLVVVTIMGVIAGIAVYSYVRIIEKTEEDVCDANALLLKREYERSLVLENIDHSDVFFASFLMGSSVESCEGCEFTYEDGDVLCNKRTEGDKDENGEVPFF